MRRLKNDAADSCACVYVYICRLVRFEANSITCKKSAQEL
jgi:hypothetical protein